MGQNQSGEDESAFGPSPNEDSKTMKAFVMEVPGEISDLKLATVYIPKPDEGEIRVRVMAAGLNPVDYKRCMFTDAEFPCILGADVAGVVVELGKGVTSLKIGDRVHFHANVRRQYGGFAEYALTTALTAVPIPEGLTFAQAAAIPCSGWTAYLALYQKLKVRRGQTILITGASGGVGCFAVQLAKLSGLKVFARTQPHKAEFVRSLGADHIFLTNEGEETTLHNLSQWNNGELLDHVLDTVGSSSATSALQLLKLHGSLCSLSALVSGPELFARGVSLHYVNIGGMHQSQSTEMKHSLSQLGKDMGALFAAKQLKVPIMEECAMEQIPVALETLRRGLVQGKLVANIVPADQQEAEAAAIAIALSTQKPEQQPGGPTYPPPPVPAVPTQQAHYAPTSPSPPAPPVPTQQAQYTPPAFPSPPAAVPGGQHSSPVAPRTAENTIHVALQNAPTDAARQGLVF